MAFYRYHLFFCINQREDGRQCCAAAGSKDMRDYLKGRVKALGLAGPGGIRVNTAGCLGRCVEGPAVVVYPDGVWYSYRGEADLDEILDEHLIGGRVASRLQLPS